MKITKLKIKNMFGIKEYESDGKNVELTGTNGTGKSSVLDSIRYALTNRSDRKYIIRDGENEGEVIVETDTGLMIDRKARTGMTDYKSVKQNGMTVNSPEAFLKDIITPLQLQPIEFMEMDEKSQNAVILNMIEYPWTMDTIRKWFGEIPGWVNYDQNILSILNDIQDEKGDYFMNRQDINRDIRAKRSIITDIGSTLPLDYDGDHWDKVSLNELYTKIEKIRKSNETIEKAKRLKDGHDSKIRSFEADREIALTALDREITAEGNNIDTELATLRERISALEKEKSGLVSKKADKEAVIRSEHEKKVAQFESEIAAYEEYADKETEPVDALMKEAETAEKMKSHINEWRRMLNLEKEVEELTEKSQSLTTKIEKARTLPGEILETAKIPIDGLTVKDGIPLINGLPISNLSEGEKLTLCVDVASQNTSGLQIILIDGIEKLSDENRSRLYERCKEKGLQFIATRTDNSGELTVTEL